MTDLKFSICWSTTETWIPKQRTFAKFRFSFLNYLAVDGCRTGIIISQFDGIDVGVTANDQYSVANDDDDGDGDGGDDAIGDTDIIIAALIRVIMTAADQYIEEYLMSRWKYLRFMSPDPWPWAH